MGHLHDHLEAKVIDENGFIVPMGTPGELCVRGYCNVLGYWGDEAKTKELIGDDKWLRTGYVLKKLSHNFFIVNVCILVINLY